MVVTAGGRLMIIDMGGGTVDMTIHKVDTQGDAVNLSELTHRECLAEVWSNVWLKKAGHCPTAVHNCCITMMQPLAFAADALNACAYCLST
jgi:hypothetical protein